MPKGIPVATVAVDGSQNAALLVVEMLAISDEGLAKRLADTVKQREKAGLECGTARREHAAVADADNW